MLALKVGRGPVSAAGALSAFVWNFFFLEPRFTFVIATLEDAILFGLYFIVASSFLRRHAPTRQTWCSSVTKSDFL